MKGSPYEAGKIPNRIALGDVNGDGINDIVSSDNEAQNLLWANIPRASPLLS